MKPATGLPASWVLLLDEHKLIFMAFREFIPALWSRPFAIIIEGDEGSEPVKLVFPSWWLGFPVWIIMGLFFLSLPLLRNLWKSSKTHLICLYYQSEYLIRSRAKSCQHFPSINYYSRPRITGDLINFVRLFFPQTDLLLCLVTMPLTLVEILTKYWPMGRLPFLCKSIGTLQATSIFVSTISITAIALDRYQVRGFWNAAVMQTCVVLKFYNLII